MSKGLIGGSIPLLVTVVVAAMFFVTLGPVMSDYLASEVAESINDLNRASFIKSRTQSYFHDTVPLGAAYSTHQKTYKLGGDSGGVSWSSGNLGSVESSARQLLETRILAYFSDHYGRSGITGCEVSGQESFRVSVFRDSVNEVRGVIQVRQPLSTVCEFRESRLKYVEKGAFLRSYEASHNRYFKLLQQNVRFFRDLKSEWKKVEEYEGSHSSCPASRSKVERKAEEDAVQNSREIKTLFRKVVGKYPKVDSFKVTTASIVSPGQVLKQGTRIGFYQGEAVYETDETSCNCDEDGDNCDTGYSSTVTLMPETTKVAFELKDQKYRIPTAGGWKHLKFFVKPYKHSFR